MLLPSKTVSVTVNVPEGIMQFLKNIIPSTSYESVQEYLEDCIVSRVEGDIDGDVFNPTIKQVTKRYHLEGIFNN